MDQELHISSVNKLQRQLKESYDMDVKEWILRDIM